MTALIASNESCSATINCVSSFWIIGWAMNAHGSLLLAAYGVKSAMPKAFAAMTCLTNCPKPEFANCPLKMFVP